MLFRHLGDRARRSANEMSLLSLPSSTSDGRAESRICLIKSKYSDKVEAPCPRVVSSAKSDKTDLVAAQMGIENKKRLSIKSR
jgi:hypothetical protein